MTTAVYARLFKHIVTVRVLVMCVCVCVCVLQLTPISILYFVQNSQSQGLLLSFLLLYQLSVLFYILPSFAFVEASSSIFYLAILFHAFITLWNVVA